MDYIIKYWVEFLFGIIITSVTLLYRKLNKYQNEQKAMRDGMKALLRDRIIQKCKHHIEDGNISDDDLDEIYYMNVPYRELGGNGTVKTMIRKVEDLQIKVERKEEN